MRATRPLDRPLHSRLGCPRQGGVAGGRRLDSAAGELLAQVERGWREPNTLRALQLAQEQQALTASDADELIENYRELRRLEGILRRWSFEGEAVLPTAPAAFYRVSVRCGFETPEAFRLAVAKWRNRIREVYEKVFPPTETHRS